MLNQNDNENVLEELVEKHSILSSFKYSLTRDSDINRSIHFLLSLRAGNIKLEYIELFPKFYSTHMLIQLFLNRKIMPITISDRNIALAVYIFNSR